MQAGLNGSRTLEDVYDVVEDNITDAKGSDGVIKDFKKKGADRQISLDLKYKFGDLKEILDEKYGASKETLVAATKVISEAYGELTGNEDVEVILYDGLYVSNEETGNGVDKSEAEGFHESETRKVYVNLDKVQNSVDLMATLAHEMNHVDDMDRGVAYDGLNGNREDVAHATGDQMREFLQDDFGVAEDNTISHQSWMYRQDFSAENSLVDEVKQAEPAQFGEKPLEPLENYPEISKLTDGEFFDRNNIKLYHEHLFFEDKDENVGFFPEEVVWNSEYKSKYKLSSTHYDDDLMRKALRNVKKKNYNLIINPKFNCQDWGDEVREEYFMLELFEKMFKGQNE